MKDAPHHNQKKKPKQKKSQLIIFHSSPHPLCKNVQTNLKYIHPWSHISSSGRDFTIESVFQHVNTFKMFVCKTDE